MKEPLLNMLEIKDGALYIDGTELTSISSYELRHFKSGMSTLTVTMDVILKGQDDWIFQ